MSVNFSPEGSAFANDKPNQPPQVITSIVNDIYVRIDWDIPYSGESTILSYSILIGNSEGDFIAEPIYCSGDDPSVTFCDVTKTILREDPFNLQQGSTVFAIVKARNDIGESNYSEPNSIGAIIEDIPSKMLTPTRGTLTSES